MTTTNSTTAAGGVPSGRPARILGVDGKTYPPARLSKDDQRFVIGHVHALKHLDGLSVRKIRAHLEDEFCLRRSVGWVSTILTTWQCDHCAAAVQVASNGQPEHPSGVAA